MPPKRLSSPSPSASDSGSSDASSSASDEEEQQQQKQQKQQTPKEEEEEDDDEASEDDDSPPKAPAKPDMPKPKEAAAADPTTKPAASDSDSDSESASSDSDAKLPPPPPPRRPSRGADPSIKPITSKPMDGAPKPKKGASRQAGEKRKRKEPEAAAAAAAEEEEEAPANGLSGKKLFQRVWTEEDEIAILKGMIQAKNRGEEPESAIDDFLKLIHKSLHSEFSKTQLADKMRRLKKKYETNLRRGKKGADPTFAKNHDQAVFVLSKKIWGGDAVRHYGDDDMEVEKEGGKEARRRSAPSPVGMTSPRRDGRGSSVDGKEGAVYPKLRDAVARLEGQNGGSLFKGSLSEAFDLLKPETAKALEEKWHNHFVAGLKHFLERSELEKELLKSLIEALENA